MVPLLQAPLENPHATLITLFMNAVDETLTDQDKLRDLTPHSTTIKRLLKYLPQKEDQLPAMIPHLSKLTLAGNLSQLTSTSSTGKYKINEAARLIFLRSRVNLDSRYLENFVFHEAADSLSAMMKEKHTIIDKRPYRLKLRPGQPGAQDEFDRHIGGEMSGKERYVELKRTHRGML